MALTAEDIQRLRRRVDEAQQRRITAESRAAAAEEEEARILQQVRERYGVDTLDDLNALLEREEAELATLAEQLTAALDEADRAVAGLPE